MKKPLRQNNMSRQAHYTKYIAQPQYFNSAIFCNKVHQLILTWWRFHAKLKLIATSFRRQTRHRWGKRFRSRPGRRRPRCGSGSMEGEGRQLIWARCPQPTPLRRGTPGGKGLWVEPPLAWASPCLQPGTAFPAFWAGTRSL